MIHITRETILNVLRDARAKIDTPEKWTKGAYVRRGGVSLADYPSSLTKNIQGADCYCASGALWSVIPWGLSFYKSLIHDVVAKRVIRDTPFQDLIGFNDDEHTTHAMVLEAFDKAIAAEGRKSKNAVF